MITSTTHQSMGELVRTDDFSPASHACSSSVHLETAVCFGGPVRDGSPAGIQPCVVTDFFSSSSLVWFSSTSGWLRLTSGPAHPFPICSSSFTGAVIDTEPGFSNSRANRLSRFGSAENREWTGSKQEGCQVSSGSVRGRRAQGYSGSVCASTIQARTSRVSRWSQGPRVRVSGDAVANQVFSTPRGRRRSSANPEELREATFCVAPAPEAVGQPTGQWCQNRFLGLGGSLELDYRCISQTPEGGDAWEDI